MRGTGGGGETNHPASCLTEDAECAVAMPQPSHTVGGKRGVPTETLRESGQFEAPLEGMKYTPDRPNVDIQGHLSRLEAAYPKNLPWKHVVVHHIHEPPCFGKKKYTPSIKA